MFLFSFLPKNAAARTLRGKDAANSERVAVGGWMRELAGQFERAGAADGAREAPSNVLLVGCPPPNA